MGETELFIKAISSSYNELLKHKSDLDNLNVFPVADSDTGTNMCRTMKAGIDILRRESFQSVSEALEKMSKAMLRNARGNSGVILSASFKGFSASLKGRAEINSQIIHGGFENAIEEVTSALSNPQFSGTILSVLSLCRDVFRDNSNMDIKSVFRILKKKAEQLTAETKNQMDVLKKADVVDAGAMGLCLIIGGIESVLNNSDYSDSELSFSPPIKIGKPLKLPCIYCTEFIIVRKNDASDKTLERSLSTLGESLAIVADSNIIKVHIHTNSPNHVLSYALKFGQLTDIKIDNMALQTEQAYNQSFIDS